MLINFNILYLHVLSLNSNFYENLLLCIFFILFFNNVLYLKDAKLSLSYFVLFEKFTEPEISVDSTVSDLLNKMRNLFEKELELKKMDNIIKLSNGEEENDNDHYRLFGPIINTGDNNKDTEQLSNGDNEEEEEENDKENLV